jgi:hypothetical protein
MIQKTSKPVVIIKGFLPKYENTNETYEMVSRSMQRFESNLESQKDYIVSRSFPPVAIVGEIYAAEKKEIERRLNAENIQKEIMRSLR